MRLAIAAFLPAVLALGAPAATSADLDVDRADLRFRGGKARLLLETDLTATLADRPETLRVTVGSTAVFDAARISGRAKARTGAWGEYRVRDPSHLGERCRLRLRYEQVSGHLTMRISGLDADPFLAAGPAGVPVSVEISGRTASAGISFSVLSPRRWAWSLPGHGYGGHPVEHQDPPDLPPPPPGDGFWPIAEFARGGHSAVLTPLKTVLRDAGAYASLWSQHAPGTTPPQVDFGKYMVLAYIAGPGLPSNRVTIRSAEVSAGTLQVTTALARNVTSDGNTSPYAFAIVQTTTMPVAWK